MKPLLFTLLCWVGLVGSSPLWADVHNYELDIKAGPEWIHDFAFYRKNPPQIVIWLEDTEGHYVKTLYATDKIASQSWLFSGGNRRVEALPTWMFKRNKADEKGILLPSKKEPLPDAVTGATPKSDLAVDFSIPEDLKSFTIFVEVNHSTDWNHYWPKDAHEGDKNYSGGHLGSGQPSLVYSTTVDTNSHTDTKLKIIGHGSPDGTSGSIDSDITTLTTALHIVSEIVLHNRS
ncbi:hypothetical protein [Spirochaeta cellobiosiphila]|uniref:hypothetical protein n=1 Tax=Spirochaeta cellobiosiphila TaxID=504483 RepID=UPI00041DA9F2|nr:hypothetical protein [Spirochaeta cellobiosiphila]